MSGAIRLNGSTSGYVELVAPAVAGDVQVQLPQGFLPAGLVPIKTQTFTGVASVSLDDVFTSDYDNYRVILTLTAGSTITMRFRGSGVDDSSTQYVSQYLQGTSTTVNGARSAASTSMNLCISGTLGVYAMDVFGPAAAAPTYVDMNHLVGGATIVNAKYALHHNVSSAFDGFSIIGTTISGTITVYGYAKQIATPIQPPATGDLAGMALITSQSFTNVSSVSMNGCFTNDYNIYRATFSLSAGSSMTMRLRAAGADNSTANYKWGLFYVNGWVGGAAATGSATDTSFGGANPYMDLVIIDPAVAGVTTMGGLSTGQSSGGMLEGLFNASTVFDGFTLLGTSMTGTLRIYGMTN